MNTDHVRYCAKIKLILFFTEIRRLYTHRRKVVEWHAGKQLGIPHNALCQGEIRNSITWKGWKLEPHYMQCFFFAMT